MKTRRLSVRAAIRFAWAAYKKHIGLFTACMLSFLAAWVVLETIVIAGQRLGYLLWTAAHLGFLILFAGMQVGLIRICLAVHDGRVVHYHDLFQSLSPGAAFLLAQLIYVVLVVAGLLLLILPGAYFGTRCTFYGFLLGEGRTDLKGSFQQSAWISRDANGSLFWILAYLLLFNILGASMLGIGLLVTVPISVLVKTYAYRQLTAR